MNLLLALAVVAVILVATEVLWRQKLVHNEDARKIIHIGVGSFVAFWPYFMSWRQIQLLSLILLVVVLVSRQKQLFNAVHSVSRRTWGEIYFPIGIGVSAFVAPAPIIFTAAILHLSLADGLAAVVGVRFGMLRKYKVGQYIKTVLGTLTFLLISSAIILGTMLISNGFNWPLWPLLVWLPLAATLTENLAVGGLDNLAVPLLIIFVLQFAQVT